MAIAAVGVTNLADAAASTVTVDASVASAPAAKLLNPHVGNKSRVNAAAWYIQIDHGSSLSIDTVMLAGVSSSLAAAGITFRVRGGPNADMLAPTFDTGTISGAPYFSADYGLFVYLRAAVSVRYLRIDLAETAVTYLEAGRLFVGLRDAFDLNFEAPWARSAVRGSVATIGVGGQTFVDLRRGHWRQSARFGFLSAADRNGFLETIAVATVNGGHKDMLWIPDPDSTNLSRDCLWGYVDGDLTTSHDKYTTEYQYSAELPIRQRL
jgi:hypothetical protein